MLLGKDFFDRNGFTVEVEVTPYCNFRCGYCENNRDAMKWKRFDERSDMNVDFDALFRFIQNLKTDRLTVLLNGGEPTLHPGLANFCEKTGRVENLTVMLCTNMSADKDVYRTL